MRSPATITSICNFPCAHISRRCAFILFATSHEPNFWQCRHYRSAPYPIQCQCMPKSGLSRSECDTQELESLSPQWTIFYIMDFPPSLSSARDLCCHTKLSGSYRLSCLVCVYAHVNRRCERQPSLDRPLQHTYLWQLDLGALVVCTRLQWDHLTPKYQSPIKSYQESYPIANHSLFFKASLTVTYTYGMNSSQPCQLIRVGR